MNTRALSIDAYNRIAQRSGRQEDERIKIVLLGVGGVGDVVQMMLNTDVEIYDSINDSLTRPLQFNISSMTRMGIGNPHGDLEEEFEELFQTWHRETQFLSSTEQRVLHPAYQRIIGMGEKALPFLFEKLKLEFAHVFWALKAITGSDPVPPEFRGDIERMREIWLEWGINRGLFF